MAHKPKFAQHASGSFQAQTLPGTHHCGVTEGQGMFSYTVDIQFQAGTHVLDDSGFLLDNTDFYRHFNSLPPIGVSCEMLAHQSAEYFLETLGTRANDVAEISVQIHPFQGVYVQATVKPGEQE